MSDWWYQYYMDKDEEAERAEEVTNDPDELRDDDSWYEYIPKPNNNNTINSKKYVVQNIESITFFDADSDTCKFVMDDFKAAQLPVASGLVSESDKNKE